MSTISHRSWAPKARPLSYGERAELHWNSLTSAHKKRILLYLSRRLVRRARAALAELGKTLIIETLDEARLIRAYVFLFAASLAKLVQELREVARREFAEFVNSFRTGRFPSTAWFEVLALVVLFAVVIAMPRSPDRPSIVEQARMVRNHPPPPCVSDGDGGVWIDIGRGYVKQRDADYARLRLALCGY